MTVLDEVKASLDARLRELAPLIEEHAELQQALAALNGQASGGQPTTRERTGKPTTARRRGRPRGTGSRAQEALGYVHAQPGITIAELAKRMKIQTGYLYRVLPQLEKDGKVKKDLSGYHPVDGQHQGMPGA